MLDCLARDINTKSIALQLNISYVTVRNHIQSIQRKLGVHSIPEAIACYLLRS